MDQHGQATPLLALLVLAIGGLTFGLARFGATVTHAAQAQAAADAAALAGAADDDRAAQAVAADNGARLATYEVDGREVEVRAVVGDAWAVARARRTGGGRGVTGWVGTSSTGGAAARLHPAVRDALAAAADVLHQPVPIVRAAGMAVDVPRTFAARLASIGPRVGLCQLPHQSDPVRFVPCQSSNG